MRAGNMAGALDRATRPSAASPVFRAKVMPNPPSISGSSGLSSRPFLLEEEVQVLVVDHLGTHRQVQRDVVPRRRPGEVAGNRLRLAVPASLHPPEKR
jgi:hypothetical protein